MRAISSFPVRQGVPKFGSDNTKPDLRDKALENPSGEDQLVLGNPEGAGKPAAQVSRRTLMGGILGGAVLGALGRSVFDLEVSGGNGANHGIGTQDANQISGSNNTESPATPYVAGSEGQVSPGLVDQALARLSEFLKAYPDHQKYDRTLFLNDMDEAKGEILVRDNELLITDEPHAATYVIDLDSKRIVSSFYPQADEMPEVELQVRHAEMLLWQFSQASSLYIHPYIDKHASQETRRAIQELAEAQPEPDSNILFEKTAYFEDEKGTVSLSTPDLNNTDSNEGGVSFVIKDEQTGDEFFIIISIGEKPGQIGSQLMSVHWIDGYKYFPRLPLEEHAVRAEALLKRFNQAYEKGLVKIG